VLAGLSLEGAMHAWAMGAGHEWCSMSRETGAPLVWYDADAEAKAAELVEMRWVESTFAMGASSGSECLGGAMSKAWKFGLRTKR
jgi:hypothetical protein